jgi:hypothetical protein
LFIIAGGSMKAISKTYASFGMPSIAKIPIASIASSVASRPGA